MIKTVKKHTGSYYFDKNVALYFDYFGIEYNPLELLKQIRNKSITHNSLEYKMMNLSWVDFFVVLLWKIYLHEKLC